MSKLLSTKVYIELNFFKEIFSVLSTIIFTSRERERERETKRHRFRNTNRERKEKRERVGGISG
jgi:hypothetical protein